MSCFRALPPYIVTAKSFVQRAAIIGALGLVGGSACSKAPKEGDCEKLLLHIVEIEIGAGQANKSDRARHKLDLAAGTRTNFVKRCNEELKASQVTCSLKAKTSEELEACDS